jgi:RimJ/RimL family protein N-acetyltransferase
MARWRRRRADAPITVRFGDDAVLHFRLIQPDDREQLRRGFEHLTEPSRYRRFLRAVDELSESDLDYFTKVDNENHLAWVAFLRRPGEDELGIGVGRYIRLADDPDTAEIALTVVDEYQGKGIGRVLLWLLTRSAAARRIRRFTAVVHSSNRPMLALTRGMNATVEAREGGTVRLVAELPRSFRAASRLPRPPLLAQKATT